MNAMNEKISAIGVVPVIKLNHPERDAAKLGKALSAGGVPVAEIGMSFSPQCFFKFSFIYTKINPLLRLHGKTLCLT
jgi:2-keto-3-deoxy-6-phosphogluconate aldolase